MNKELQQKWDTLLMRGWQLEKSIGWVVYHFFDKRMEIDSLDELVSLGIKRSYHRSTKNTNAIGYKVPVRAYVYLYCKELSNKLWNGEPAIIYMFNLDEFKWINLNHKVKAKYKTVRNKASRNRMRTKHLGMAGGVLHDSRHGWKVTK